MSATKKKTRSTKITLLGRSNRGLEGSNISMLIRCSRTAVVLRGVLYVDILMSVMLGEFLQLPLWLDFFAKHQRLSPAVCLGTY